MMATRTVDLTLDGRGAYTFLAVVPGTITARAAVSDTDPGKYIYLLGNPVPAALVRTFTQSPDGVAVGDVHTLHEIKVLIRCRRTLVGPLPLSNARPVLYQGALAYGTLLAVTATGAYTELEYTWTTNAALGRAWTPTDLDALQVGVELQNLGDPSSPTTELVRCEYLRATAVVSMKVPQLDLTGGAGLDLTGGARLALEVA